MRPALAPFIQTRVNDSPSDGKRVELFRLPQADGRYLVEFDFVLNPAS